MSTKRVTCYVFNKGISSSKAWKKSLNLPLFVIKEGFRVSTPGFTFKINVKVFVVASNEIRVYGEAIKDIYDYLKGHTTKTPEPPCPLISKGWEEVSLTSEELSESAQK